MEALIRAAEAAADVAAAVIRPFYRQRLRADDKADSSPVTIADRSAEQAMRAVLSQRFPEHGIVGEEFGEDRPGARYRWVLDPLDGTRAFLTGRPLFGTLVGLLEGDVPVLGIIDQPITGERWVGVRGQKTRFYGAHGQPGCRPCARLADAELSSTSPDLFTPESFAAFRRVQEAARRTTWGGDGYAYGLLALGSIDAIVEPGLKLWDWAALVPVIEGAGGLLRTWQGEPLRPGGPGDVIAVGDPALLPHIAALLA